MKNSTLFFIFAVIATQAIIATAADSIAALQCVVEHKEDIRRLNTFFAEEVQAYFKKNVENKDLTVDQCVNETEKIFEKYFKNFFINTCHAPDTYSEIQPQYSIELIKQCKDLIAQRPPAPAPAPVPVPPSPLKIMSFGPSFP
uniref:Uncharacterized protein n=1 Tax=Panagrolaimus sp. JU765 TaxID=591449 RepID=A0AC34RK79_9BILA